MAEGEKKLPIHPKSLANASCACLNLDCVCADR